MLLPVKEPTCAQDLQKIIEMIGWLLDYVADWAGDSFDRQDFRARLKDTDYASLINVRSTFGLPTLLQLSQDERKQIRDAFYNDIQFCDHLESPDFEFLFSSLRETVEQSGENKGPKDVGKAFLLLFYERLASSGFHDQTGGTIFCLTRTLVEEGYRRANEKMARLCPACLGLLEERTSKTSLVDCEHFFPRKLYPPLIIHPNNLIFVCKACNQQHNDDNPIDPIRGSEVGGLRRIFVPYRRSALKARDLQTQELDELSLKFNMEDSEKPLVKLVGGPDEYTSARVENLDRLYGLSERWSKLLPGIYETIRESARIDLEDQPLTQQNIKRYLNKEFRKHNMLSQSREGEYLTGQYLRWIQQERSNLLMKELTMH